MGGFVLYVDGEPRATLTPDELLRFVHEGSVEMPTITEAEIKDRSKGDGISKCVSILQLVWFVIQFFARYAQGLPVTLLEIDTMGIAALACITYGFWWKKPKDIGRPCIVHWKSEVTAPPRGSLANEYRYVINITSRACSDLPAFEYSSPGKRRSYPSRPVVPLSAASFQDGDREYYAMIDRERYAMIVLCVSGMIFAGIHCLGWNYLFQAHKEQILWRVASVGMACSPLIFVIQIVIDMAAVEFAISARYIASGGLMVIYTSIYVFSRITIFVLVFLSLRSLPPGAYDTVAWTMHIPHVTL
jgi:hypothetical protein